MNQPLPGRGTHIDIGRSLLPELHLNYYLTNPETGQLEHHCKTPDGKSFVTIIDRARLRALLTQLHHHAIDLLDGKSR